MIVRTVEIVRPGGPGIGRSAADHRVRERDPEPLSGLGEAARSTLIAVAVEDGLRFDIHLQGPSHTTFFAV